MSFEDSTEPLEPNGRTAEANTWRELATVALEAAGYWSEAQEFLDCQDPETLRWYRVCDEDANHYAKPVVHTCHKRYCPDCAKREVGRLLRRYKDHIETVVKHGPTYYRLRKIEFTTKYSLTDDDARERYKQMWDAINQAFTKLFGWDWYQKGMGYIAGAEFGEKGKKLHAHVLFYGAWINKKQLSAVWKEVTNGDNEITYIREVTVEEGVKEVLKYSTKFSHLASQDVPALYEVLKGTRRIRSRGEFYNLPEEIEEPFNCPECEAPIVRWLPSQYDQWKEAQRTLSREALEQMLARLQSLDLKQGNKSPPPLPGFEEISANSPPSEPENHYLYLD